MSKLHVTIGMVAVALLVATPAFAAKNCDALPRSALQTRSCNPQAECLAAIGKDVKGPALAARRKECDRLPASGVCHGPDQYDPQAECREKRKK